MKTKRTKERLAEVLEREKLQDLAFNARLGLYDDFESDSATPQTDLVRALMAKGRKDLARRAADGEWDATREEAEAWSETPEARKVIRDLRRGK